MRINKILKAESVIAELKAATKSEALLELAAALAAATPHITEARVFAALNERESLGSTGIGSGLAIPHAKLKNLDHMLAVFARSPRGVDFSAFDGQPVHFFFALLGPEAAAGPHLQVLAHISRMFKDAQFKEALRVAPDARTLHEVILRKDSMIG